MCEIRFVVAECIEDGFGHDIRALGGVRWTIKGSVLLCFLMKELDGLK